MAISEQTSQVIQKVIRPSMTAAEIYHGEREDILAAMAEAVGPQGKVYGIDGLNPFSNHDYMVQLAAEHPNISFLPGKIPPIPSEVPPLDALAFRELCWAFGSDLQNAQDPTYQSRVRTTISNSIRPGGLLLLLDNTTQNPDPAWQRIESGYVQLLPAHFDKIYTSPELRIYKKNSV